MNTKQYHFKINRIVGGTKTKTKVIKKYGPTLLSILIINVQFH